MAFLNRFVRGGVLFLGRVLLWFLTGEVADDADREGRERFGFDLGFGERPCDAELGCDETLAVDPGQNPADDGELPDDFLNGAGDLPFRLRCIDYNAASKSNTEWARRGPVESIT